MRTLVLLALVFAARGADADTTARAKSTLSFSEHGFSIDPPVGHDATQTQQVVMLALPTSDGFSPNVNVQVQPFSGTMDEYVKVSLDQFKANGVKIVAEKHDAKSAMLEFTGPYGGRPLHWYSRAFLGKNGVVLATATAGEPQWPRLAAALRQSIDSLRPLP
ncbi:MAG: hypothetical protein ACXVDD_04130 [Polyangia bacterium]